MKRLMLIIMMTAILFTLTACGGPKPEDTVVNYLKAAQQFDVETMAAAIVPANSEDITATKDLTEAENDEYTKYFLEYLKANAAKMTYTIARSEVNADKAAVTVNCKYVDGGPLLKATIGEAFTKLIGMAFSGVEMSEEENNQMFMGIMKEQSAIMGESFRESTIVVDCIKQDNIWYIEQTNEDLMDVVTSGFISAGKEISDAFIESGEESDELEVSQTTPSDKLAEIDEFIIDDIWNKGFCDIYHYLEDGKGSSGQNIDIEFTKSQLDKAMKKIPVYNAFVDGLDSNYAEIKELWGKLSLEIDKLYQQVTSGATTLNTDIFSQYRDAFSDAVYDLQ